MHIILLILSFVFISFGIFGQSIKLDVLGGGSIDLISTEKITSYPTGIFSYKKAPGLIIGANLSYQINEKIGVFSGVNYLINNNYEILRKPFINNEIYSDFKFSYTIEQVSIPLNLSYSINILNKSAKIQLFTGPSFNFNSISSFGGESNFMKLYNDSIRIDVINYFNFDTGNFFTLGCNTGMDINPLGKLNRFSLGLKYNFQFKYSSHVTINSVYISPYTGRKENYLINVINRPNYIALYLKFKLFSINLK